MRKLELYIHIPFCMKKCNYCDFLSMAADEKSQSAYMEGLKREIAFYGQGLRGTVLSTVYIGGGTPSWLQEHYIEEIMQEVGRFFVLEPGAEVTIECNPGTLTRAKLECYRRCGINRLSIGLQSADDGELALLGRIHTFGQFLRNYELARECGFSNINIDLMNCLPGQTLESCRRTLEKVARLNPEHISAYSLMIEEGTPFYDKYKFDLVRQEAGLPTEELPDEDAAYRMGKLTQDFLAEKGYLRYEISNYAKKGFACRHNIGYWQRKEYLGLGLGASSLVGEVRFRNIRDLDEYLEGTRHIEETDIEDRETGRRLSGISLHEEAAAVKREARMEEFMFLGLRMTEGIEKGKFYRTFGFTVDNIYGNVVRMLEGEGLIEDTPLRLRLTDRGTDLSNFVLAQFLL